MYRVLEGGLIREKSSFIPYWTETEDTASPKMFPFGPPQTKPTGTNRSKRLKRGDYFGVWVRFVA